MATRRPNPAWELARIARSMAGISTGVVLFGLSNGGNFALVALKVSSSGAPDSFVGLMTSVYFAGTLTASLTCAGLVGRLGHRLSFGLAASAACLSTGALVAIEEPVLWLPARCATGYAIGMYYIVVESWFNHATENRTRGRVLAYYETLRLTAVAAGSFLLLGIYDAVGAAAFPLAGLLYLSAILPVAINGLSGPAPGRTAPFQALRLLRLAPLGSACCFVGGLTTASIYGLTPLYGQQLGLDSAALSMLIFVSHFGALFVQFPTGALSDRIGRNRTILALCLVCTTASATLGPWTSPPFAIVMVAAAVTGGICHTVFTLGAVSTNDRIDPTTYTAGAAALLVAYDIGTVLGPIFASATMEIVGKGGLYLFISGAVGALALLAAWRCVRERVVVPD